MRFSPFLLLLFILTACTSDRAQVAEEVAEDTEAVGEFQADPQPVPEQEVTTLSVGTPGPDFRLPGVDGEFHSLADYAEAEVIVLIFTTNHCPTAQAYEERIKEVQRDYGDRGVQIIAISPNSPLGVMYNELGYSDLDDTYADMKLRAEEAEFNFPYLYDGDDHAVSLQYGPVATPHVFVLDRERVIRYTGRLDRSEKPGTANAEDLRAALDDLLAGRPVATAETKTFGCSTKWAWKTAYKEKDEAAWAALPVELDEISAAGVRELVANDGEKLRLVNVWATWCGPCVAEYPEFVILHRMYSGRDFEFVSVSADKPEQGERVLKFLTEKAHSPVENYHFTGGDVYELVEAIDPAWNGALPYTLLVAPGGEVVWSKQGEVDFMELRRAIVEHPMIGRYF